MITGLAFSLRRLLRVICVLVVKRTMYNAFPVPALFCACFTQRRDVKTTRTLVNGIFYMGVGLISLSYCHSAILKKVSLRDARTLQNG